MSTPWTTQYNREPGLTMNLLWLLLLVAFAAGASSVAVAPEKAANANDESQKPVTDSQEQPGPQDENGDKKVAKRSYGWNPWNYGGYSYGWPWYGGGHGWYPGWYPSWPLFYGGHGYGGYDGYHGWSGHGGWYKGW